MAYRGREIHQTFALLHIPYISAVLVHGIQFFSGAMFSLSKFTPLAIFLLFTPTSVIGAVSRPDEDLILASPSPMPFSTRNSSGLQSFPSTYWLSLIKRQGNVSFGEDPSYNVFRNVRDFGAVGILFILPSCNLANPQAMASRMIRLLSITLFRRVIDAVKVATRPPLLRR